MLLYLALWGPGLVTLKRIIQPMFWAKMIGVLLINNQKLFLLNLTKGTKKQGRTIQYMIDPVDWHFFQ